jgi:predicted nuclease of predicted toxin-antitoxin system
VTFLADECCDARVASRLRAVGYDVARVPASRGIVDAEVVRMAEMEGRMLLTQDLGFRRIAALERRPTTGAIILRFRPDRWAELVERLLALIEEEGDRLAGGFWLVSPSGAAPIVRHRSPA